MSTTDYSIQYGLPCIIPEPGDTAADIISHCRSAGAVRRLDGVEYVVQLRDDIGPELWTEESLRSSIPAAPQKHAAVDDVRQALMDAQAQLRGIRSAARAGEALGQVAYQRYSAQVQARSVSGDPLPPWAELRRGKPNVANAWVWAAAAVADVVLRGAHNGVHAAAEAAEDDPTEAAAREREERAQTEAHP